MKLLYGGFEIVENQNMLVNDGPPIKRTWRERLFSRPWRPLVTHRQPMKPDPDFIVSHDERTIFCHPATARELRVAITAHHGPPTMLPVLTCNNPLVADPLAGILKGVKA